MMMARATDEQRRVTCALARKRIAFARNCAEVHAKRRGLPGMAFIAVQVGEDLGMRHALRVLAPGRWQHYAAVADRIARRFDRMRRRKPAQEAA